MARRGRPRMTSPDCRMTKNLDDLARYEEFQKEILPALQTALRKGKGAEEIYKMAEGIAAARAVTIAATEQDAAKALAAVREILDRTRGKAKERTEIEHKYSKLKEEELDSLLLSELGQVEDDDSPEAHH